MINRSVRYFSNFMYFLLKKHNFKKNVWNNEYLRALVFSCAGDNSVDPDKRYALFRLGCYISATNGASTPRSARETVALCVSFAAQSRSIECREALRLGFSMLKKHRTLLVEAARGLARYDPDLSLSLLSNVKGEIPLKAAVAHKSGDIEQAKLNISNFQHPTKRDLFNGYNLIIANTNESPKIKLKNLNAHFGFFELTACGLLDDSRPPSVANIIASQNYRTVQPPLVSILMPAYQANRWIEFSLNSLLNQTYSNIEIIVIDDASDDGTSETVKRIAVKDPRIHLVRLDINSGPYVARNSGLSMAQGEFVTVHDSDDFAHPQKIERQIKPMRENPEIIFTLSDLIRVNEEGVFGNREVYPIQRLNPSSLMFRKEKVLSKAGKWEEVRFGADSEFIFRLQHLYPKFAWLRLRQPLTIASSHENSLTCSPATGNAESGMNMQRIEYTENYVHKLLKKTCNAVF